MISKHFISLVLISMLSIASFGTIGFLAGTDLGGNFTANEVTCQTVQGVESCTEFHSFTYWGLPGYEGAGLLGLHVGMLVGLLIGILFWKRQTQQRARLTKNTTDL